MKRAHLGVSFPAPQLSGELLLLFVLTTYNETSTPPHPLLSVHVFSGDAMQLIMFTLTASSRLRLTPHISYVS